MTRMLLTGLSGTGKSTVGEILQDRGYTVVETDDPGWCVPEAGDGSQPDYEWGWDERRINDLLEAHDDQHLILIGCRQNQGKFYGQFAQVIVLTAPIDALRQRLGERISNPFGKNAEQWEHIQASKREVEPLLIRGASLVIDTSTSTPEQIADQLVRLLYSTVHM